MASACTPSANDPSKDVILVYTVQLKPMIICKKLSKGGLFFCSSLYMLILAPIIIWNGLACSL